jgi:hypothetical protein
VNNNVASIPPNYPPATSTRPAHPHQTAKSLISYDYLTDCNSCSIQVTFIHTKILKAILARLSSISSQVTVRIMRFFVSKRGYIPFCQTNHV